MFQISDFARNASEYTLGIRRTKRAEILIQHGRLSLAVMSAEKYQRQIATTDYMDEIGAVKKGS